MGSEIILNHFYKKAIFAQQLIAKLLIYKSQ
jgi:hypothetical protein